MIGLGYAYRFWGIGLIYICGVYISVYFVMIRLVIYLCLVYFFVCLVIFYIIKKLKRR